jgi:hypothetical protein
MDGLKFGVYIYSKNFTFSQAHAILLTSKLFYFLLEINQTLPINLQFLFTLLSHTHFHEDNVAAVSLIS